MTLLDLIHFYILLDLRHREILMSLNNVDGIILWMIYINSLIGRPVVDWGWM